MKVIDDCRHVYENFSKNRKIFEFRIPMRCRSVDDELLDTIHFATFCRYNTTAHDGDRKYPLYLIRAHALKFN